MGFVELPLHVGLGFVEAPLRVGPGFVEAPLRVGLGFVELPLNVGLGFVESPIHVDLQLVQALVQVTHQPRGERAGDRKGAEHRRNELSRGVHLRESSLRADLQGPNVPVRPHREPPPAVGAVSSPHDHNAARWEGNRPRASLTARSP